MQLTGLKRVRGLGRCARTQAVTLLQRIAVAVALPVLVLPAQAHPHVFVDGGVDFVFNENGLLSALEVTWLYDEFESLYILSSNELSLTAAGGLAEADRQHLIRQRSNWPDDFEGSAHLSVDGAPAVLHRPSGFDVAVVDGRLRVTFTRQLDVPIDLNQSSAEVAFYEATYFYAFAVTNSPQVLGAPRTCAADVIPFEAGAQDTALQAALAKLSREETPDIARVGSFFADRISIRCG